MSSGRVVSVVTKDVVEVLLLVVLVLSKLVVDAIEVVKLD